MTQRFLASFDRGALSELFVSELTPVQLEYITLHYSEGLTMREIARRFGVNVSTVSRTISRGTKKIRTACTRAERLCIPYSSETTVQSYRVKPF